MSDRIEASEVCLTPRSGRWEKVTSFLQKHRRPVSAVLFGLLMFIALIGFWNQPWFSSDEAEIFMHGQAIAQGELLYAETGSQHMPLMYYLAALFSLLGARTITGFRIWFYLFTAVLWGIMFYRYQKRWGKLALCLYPLLYICLLSHLDWTATCVLSDQYQGIGMAILLFEFLEFNEERRLSIPASCMISLAIFISFGSAFVAAFGVFVIVCAVLLLDIWDRILAKEGFWKSVLGFLKQFWQVVLIVAAPFALLFLYYLVTGTLDDFINWAYLLNRTVYVNYTGGYGNSILSGFFGGYVHYLGLFTFSPLTARAAFGLFLIFCSVGLLLLVARRGKGMGIRLVGLVLFLVACATRGLLDFHGVPALAVLCAMSACFLGRVLDPSAIKKNFVRMTALAFALVLMVTPYLCKAVPAWVKLPFANDKPENSTAWCLDTITEEGERVGFGILFCDIMVLAGVHPATVQGGSVPWFWDYAGEETMRELRSDPPRAYLYSPEHEVWGHKITEYAPELASFMDENYTSLSALGQPLVWVHNDYFEEAQNKILTARGELAP